MTWLIAYFDQDGQWQELATADTLPEARIAGRVAGEDHELVGVFKNREGWQDRRGRLLFDRRDKTRWPIGAAAGRLINSLPSDYF